jgi:class 3 adenylate cyclase/tetratricopeptide (TPR) repeat protein
LSQRFCNGCGAKLNDSGAPAHSYTPAHLAERVLISRSALEGERKLVTVLFADMAGFTALAERLDPEAVHSILEGCFEILTRSVHRYEGTVNQFTGDGIMALFGAPVAHEDHAVRALRAALTIRQDLQAYDAKVRREWQATCQMRIGINTGIVVVGRIGDNLRMDYTAIGDTTNVAARLQQNAPPGAIWVAEATHRLCEAGFIWDRLPPTKMHGRTEPVQPFELVDLRGTVFGKFDEPGGHALTPLIGREHELQQLEEAWARARLGRGRVVSVVGEAGLGKTRLLHEFKRSLRSGPNSRLYEGSCFAHGDASSYLPFRDLLKALFHLEVVSSNADATRRISNGVSDLGLNAAAIVPFLLNVLSYPVADPTFRALPAQVVRERTQAALRAIIGAVAARQPLVLVIEDLHWIDEATQEVVSGLVDDAESLSMLLLLVFRPEYLHDWRERAHYSRISVGRLPSPSSAEMVRAVLRKPHAVWLALRQLSQLQSAEMVQQILDTKGVSSQLEQWVADTTDGNPLFIEELLRSLIENGDLVRRGDSWALETSLEALSLPRTLQGLILARVDRLNDELKEVLQVGSVIGRVFNPALLAETLGRDVRLALSDLEELELVYREGDTSPAMYSFKHVLSQQAVYDALLRSKRERYHGQVGRAIESMYPDRLNEHCELLALHYEQSATPSRAVEHLQRANRKAIGVSAMADAQGYFERAQRLLAQLPDDQENNHRRLTMVLDQVFVALALFKYREYHDLLSSHAYLAERLGDRRLLGAFHARVGWCQWSMGEFAAGIDTLNRAAEHCSAAGNDDDLGLALMTRAWCELARGEFECAVQSCHDGLDALERKLDLQSYVRTYAAATVSHSYLGRWNAAQAAGAKAIEAGERYGDAGATSFAATVSSWNYARMGDLEKALALADLALAKARSPADTLFAQGSRAYVQCRSGQAAQAAEVLSGVVAVIRSMRFPACETFALYFCEALWRAGDFTRAKAAVAECLGVVEPCGMSFFVACAKMLLGEVLLAEGAADLPSVARHFEESAAIFSKLGTHNELALSWSGCGRVQQMAGNREGARDYLQRSLHLFEQLGTLLEPAQVRRALDTVG